MWPATLLVQRKALLSLVFFFVSYILFSRGVITIYVVHLIITLLFRTRFPATLISLRFAER